MLLTAGEFLAAWPLVDHAIAAWAPLEPLAGVEWDGGDELRGKMLLLRCITGLGDVLLLSRYIPELIERGVHPAIWCDAALVPLLRAQWPGVPCSEWGRNLEYDAWIDLDRLPGIFRTTRETVPSPHGYLSADAGRVAAWRERLPAGKRVGLVWAGSPDNPDDARRSMPVESLTPLLSMPGVEWISLQVGQRAGELRGPNVFDAAPLLTDFAETAAVVACLDAVAAVDTSTANLAGAMGAPLIAMLPQVAEWRWGIDRSPWYASAVPLRQVEPGNWASVVARVGAAVAAL